MNISDKMINKISKNEKEREILKFGFETLFNFITGYIVLILLGLVFNVLIEILVIAISINIIRIFTGGAHASSPLRCLVIGTIIYLILTLLVKLLINYSFINSNLYTIIIICFIIVIISILKNGFATTHKKHLFSYSHGRKLMITSIVIMFVWMQLMLYIVTLNNYNHIIISSCMGILYHAFSLSQIGFNTISFLDKNLKILNKRRLT